MVPNCEYRHAFHNLLLKYRTECRLEEPVETGQQCVPKSFPEMTCEREERTGSGGRDCVLAHIICSVTRSTPPISSTEHQDL